MNKQGQMLVPKLTLTMVANKINQRLEATFLMYHLNPQ
jgi:hypothetical protein